MIGQLEKRRMRCVPTAAIAGAFLPLAAARADEGWPKARGLKPETPVPVAVITARVGPTINRQNLLLSSLEGASTIRIHA
jgi:hypothetical protein